MKIFGVIVIGYGLTSLKIDGEASRQVGHTSSPIKIESVVDKIDPIADVQRFSSASNAGKGMPLTKIQLPQKPIVLTKTGSLEVLGAFETYYGVEKKFGVSFFDLIEKSSSILFIDVISSQVILYRNPGTFRFFESIQNYFRRYSKNNPATTIQIDTQVFKSLLSAIEKYDELEKQKISKHATNVFDRVENNQDNQNNQKISCVEGTLGKVLSTTGQVAGLVTVGVVSGIPAEKIVNILWVLYEKWRWNRMSLYEKASEFFTNHPGSAFSIIGTVVKFTLFFL